MNYEQVKKADDLPLWSTQTLRSLSACFKRFVPKGFSALVASDGFVRLVDTEAPQECMIQCARQIHPQDILHQQGVGPLFNMNVVDLRSFAPLDLVLRRP